MKQICHPEELRKALEAANLLQHVRDIQGEDQKQTDGVVLPVCEIVFKENVTDVDKANVLAIFTIQCTRDWRNIIPAEKARIEAVEADIKSGGIIQQIAAMNNAEYDAWWNARTAAQKDNMLKRLVRFMCRQLA